jgi:hypothetical protein
MPFEYYYGIVNFKTNKIKMEEIVRNVHNGNYDSLFRAKKHNENKISIDVNNSTRILIDTQFNAVFFRLNLDKSYEEYDGILYISDEKYIRDRKIFSFLRREFNYKKLESNWFWVNCYVDRTPAP